MNLRAPFFTTLVLLSACLTLACSGEVEDDNDSASGAATASEAKAGNRKASSDSGTDSSSDSGCKAPQAHQFRHNGDGGAPGTMVAQCASVVIDDKTCALALDNVGLDLGLDGHGWTVSADLDGCFGGALLTVSGVDDAAYPQTDVVPFLSEPSAWLATNADAKDDAGVGVGSFSSAPAGSSRIEQGPKASGASMNVGVVRGKARVVAEGGKARDVVFDFAF